MAPCPRGRGEPTDQLGSAAHSGGSSNRLTATVSVRSGSFHLIVHHPPLPGATAVRSIGQPQTLPLKSPPRPSLRAPRTRPVPRPGRWSTTPARSAARRWRARPGGPGGAPRTDPSTGQGTPQQDGPGRRTPRTSPATGRRAPGPGGGVTVRGTAPDACAAGVHRRLRPLNGHRALPPVTTTQISTRTVGVQACLDVVPVRCLPGERAHQMPRGCRSCSPGPRGGPGLSAGRRRCPGDIHLAGLNRADVGGQDAAVGSGPLARGPLLGCGGFA